MRVLKVNGERVDLADSTAIGVTYQSGDLSKPDIKKLTVTNKFTLPKTANNRRIFQFAESVGSTGTFPYGENAAEYWDGNIKLIANAQISISSIEEEYHVVLLDSGNVISDLKRYKLRDFLKDRYALETPISYAGLNDFSNALYNGENGVCLNFWSFNFDGTYADPFYRVWVLLGMKVSKVFEWIEDYTGYSIINTGTITDDAFFNGMCIPFYELQAHRAFGSNYKVVHIDDSELDYIYANHQTEAKKIPKRGYEYYGEKSVMDLVRSIALLFNCIVSVNENTKSINLIPFGTLIEGSAVDWSDKVIKSKKKFTAWDYGIDNYINYELDDKVSPFFGSTFFQSNNLNLTPVKSYSNGAVVGNSYKVIGSPSLSGGTVIQGIGGHESVNTSSTPYNTAHSTKPLDGLCLMVDSGAVLLFRLGVFYDQVSADPNIPPVEVDTLVSNTYMHGIGTFDFNAEYASTEKVLQDPVSYEVEMNLNRLDIHTFSFENLYKIDELGGVFYVNKIDGYNSLSKKGTKVELIKVS